MYTTRCLRRNSIATATSLPTYIIANTIAFGNAQRNGCWTFSEPPQHAVRCALDKVLCIKIARSMTYSRSGPPSRLPRSGFENLSGAISHDPDVPARPGSVTVEVHWIVPTRPRTVCISGEVAATIRVMHPTTSFQVEPLVHCLTAADSRRHCVIADLTSTLHGELIDFRRCRWSTEWQVYDVEHPPSPTTWACWRGGCKPDEAFRSSYAPAMGSSFL